jgi:hypothetical protein
MPEGKNSSHYDWSDRSASEVGVAGAKSDHYRESVRNCAELAVDAKNEPARNRYKRTEAAWLALAEEIRIGSGAFLERRRELLNEPRLLLGRRPPPRVRRSNGHRPDSNFFYGGPLKHGADLDVGGNG